MNIEDKMMEIRRSIIFLADTQIVRMVENDVQHKLFEVTSADVFCTVDDDVRFEITDMAWSNVGAFIKKMILEG